MKIFQILSGFCHWDATAVHPTLESTQGRYAPDIVFVEAPDYVFAGWGYDEAKEGDARFVRPDLPEPAEWVDEETGDTYHWAYNEKSGTFYIADEDGNPITPETLESAIEALRDAQEALAVLGVEMEEVGDNA